MPAKITTCCYCGTRAALVLKGRERHELACSSCGAPLHDLKALKKEPAAPDPAVSHLPRTRSFDPYAGRKKKKKGRRSKSGWKKFLDEAVDLVEDIFD